MSKRKSSNRKSSGQAAGGEDKPRAGFLRRQIPSATGVREGVHFVVEILVLVFLIITFEVQAFVIPTGSLAPTLLGRHKHVVCPQCGYAYQISAAGEVDSSTGESQGRSKLVRFCTCPMCRWSTDLGPDGEACPSFAGERVLVSRFAYHFAEPQRWEIAPFKYPGGATTNYIKRIVGLPGETIRIRHGDLFVRGQGETESGIARKPPDKILAMAQPVYDNDYVLPKMIQRGWPARWQGRSAAEPGPGDWVTSEDYREFHTDGSAAGGSAAGGSAAGGSAAGEVWLRYRHFVPSYRDWWLLESNAWPAGVAVKPRLIADFCAYNTGRGQGGVDGFGRNDSHAEVPGLESVGLHWVGDLALECTVEVEGQTGEAVFELVEGGRRMQCRIDVASGTARLWIEGLDGYAPEAATSVRGPGTYRIRFANVDDQLWLWVQRSLLGVKWLKPVEFDAPTTYPYDWAHNMRPKPADLSPAGIGSGGAALRVSHLKIFRDVYYIADKGHANGAQRRNGPLNDFGVDGPDPPSYPSPDGVARFLSDPSRWGRFLQQRSAEFTLEPDQFLALGDNSPRSKDSRLWEGDGFEYYVSRRLLLGKALVVIWPHSPVTLPWTNVPCLPNVPRLRAVR